MNEVAVIKIVGRDYVIEPIVIPEGVTEGDVRALFDRIRKDFESNHWSVPIVPVSEKEQPL